MEALVRTARRLVAPHLAVLGLDTAPAVLAARLRAAGIVPTAATVAAYRRMVLGADVLATRVSGIVVLPDSVAPAAGRTLLGVRADTGREPLAPRRGTVTRGLDGLSAHLRDHRRRGAAFAVWHAGPDTAAGLPALRADAHAAARFALVCQDAGLVPLVRIGAGSAPMPQVAALLAFLDQLDELGVDRAATVVATRAAAAGMLPSDLGGIATTGVPGPGRGPYGLMVGADVTGPAVSAWRGSDVAAGRRVLRHRLDAVCAPALALAAGS